MTPTRGTQTTYAELAEIIESLPLIVREIRRSRQLSLRAAAKEIGTNAPTLGRMEAGSDYTVSNLRAVLCWLNGGAS